MLLVTGFIQAALDWPLHRAYRSRSGITSLGQDLDWKAGLNLGLWLQAQDTENVTATVDNSSSITLQVDFLLSVTSNIRHSMFGLFISQVQGWAMWNSRLINTGKANAFILYKFYMTWSLVRKWKPKESVKLEYFYSEVWWRVLSHGEVGLRTKVMNEGNN